jgi:hypothetical protein
LETTDCPINKPTEFNPIWYSHKLNGAGLRYEVGLNIRTGDIVWVGGGVPCGEFNDLSLAQQRYCNSVNP